jgi:hypothetical protein
VQVGLVVELRLGHHAVEGRLGARAPHAAAGLVELGNLDAVLAGEEAQRLDEREAVALADVGDGVAVLLAAVAEEVVVVDGEARRLLGMERAAAGVVVAARRQGDALADQAAQVGAAEDALFDDV